MKITMLECSAAVTFLGNPLTLLGPEIKVRQTAQAFTALDTDLNPVSLKYYAGKVLVISSVPSLGHPGL